MTGLAGHTLDVGINAFVVVKLLVVTIYALNLIFRSNQVVVCYHFAQDAVFLSLVAVGAREIQRAHVDVKIPVGVEKVFVQFAVFYSVSAATIEVAGSTVVAAGVAHTLGRGKQINAFGGIAIVGFSVKIHISMAGQTVDVGLVGEVIILIFPAVTNVTGHAFLLVALCADTKVVDLVFLTNSHRPVAPGHIGRLAFPGPMGCLHYLESCIFMTF